MTTPPPRSAAASHALAMPFLVRAGYSLVAEGEGFAEAELLVTPELGGGTGHLNGTELYGLLDCTAWFAVATTLADAEAAVTHDAHFSLLGVAPVGTTARFVARVMKRGRTTAFVRVEGTRDGKPFALATVTKTIMSVERRMRHSG